jgi:hypothetical protein
MTLAPVSPSTLIACTTTPLTIGGQCSAASTAISLRAAPRGLSSLSGGSAVLHSDLSCQ